MFYPWLENLRERGSTALANQIIFLQYEIVHLKSLTKKGPSLMEENSKRLLLILVLTFSLSHSLQAQEPPAQKKPLLWGADPDGGIPYVFQDPNDPATTIGFEMDLARALEKELGRPIKFVKRAYESLFADLERGDIDIAMNGLEILPERLKWFRFTKPYYVYQLQLVVRAGDERVKTLKDCHANGYAVGTMGSTAAERLLKDMGIATEIYDDQEGPYKDLSLGRRIQGVLFDLPGAIYYAAPDAHLKYSRRIPGLKFVGPPLAEGYYGIAVRLQDEALAKELDRAIDAVRNNGTLKNILQKWELWTPEQYLLYQDVSVQAGGEAMTFGQYFPLLLQGAVVTIFITAMGMTLAILLGLPIALMRLYGPAPMRWAATIYVEFFRGIPVLLLLYFLYYGLASISPALELGPLQAAILGFGLNYAAYESEIYRGGIGSVPVGQWEAAASLGMPASMTFSRIILPQAVRVILPPMTNDLVALFKDTSVVSIIAVVELSKEYQILTKSGGGYLQIGLTTAILYLVMSVPLGYLSRYLEGRWKEGN
jgi:polar amino acid transport system substrate-binding protein